MAVKLTQNISLALFLRVFEVIGFLTAETQSRKATQC
jgi:hypothetical protein